MENKWSSILHRLTYCNVMEIVMELYGNCNGNRLCWIHWIYMQRDWLIDFLMFPLFLDYNNLKIRLAFIFL